MKEKRVSSERIVAWLIALVIVVPSVVRIMFFMPHKIDEYEHWHVSFLMNIKHMMPFTDFFEHHFPLFWKFTSLYYAAGLPADEITPIITGRIAVAAVFVIGLWLSYAVAKRFSDADVPSSSLFAAPALFAAIFSLQSDTFVLRPEPFAILLALFAFLAFPLNGTNRTKAAAWGSIAGALMAVSLLLSPRMAVALAGFAVLFAKQYEHSKQYFFMVGTWVVSAIVAGTIVLILLLGPDAQTTYNWAIKFNSALFSGPAFFSHWVLKQHLVGHSGWILLLLLALLHGTTFRKWQFVAFALVVLSAVASSFAGSPSYPFHQNFAAASLVATVGAGMLIPAMAKEFQMWGWGKILVLGVFSLLISAAISVGEGPLIDSTEARFYVADATGTDGHAYICPDIRPIASLTPAFYYEVMPFPDRLRLKDALKRLGNPSWAPKANIIEQIEATHPVLVDLSCLVPSADEMNQLKASLIDCYDLIALNTPYRGAPTPFLKIKQECK